MDKMYFSTKDPFEAKYQLLINKIKNIEQCNLNDYKAFIDYSNKLNVFIKILKNTIQMGNVKYCLLLFI